VLAAVAAWLVVTALAARADATGAVGPAAPRSTA
jgi:hypothetical protein